MDEASICVGGRVKNREAWEIYERVLGEDMRLFWRARFENFLVETPEQQHTLAAAKSFAAGQRGRVFVLVGTPGTGKTHLACSVIRDVIRRGVGSAAYWRMTDLLRRITGTWRAKKAKTEEQVLAELTGMSVLVIDEIEKTPQSEWERTVFIPDLIDKVWAGKRGRLMLIGNISAAELGRLWPKPTIDRLYGMGGAGSVIECNWLSFRRRELQAEVADDKPWE